MKIDMVAIDLVLKNLEVENGSISDETKKLLNTFFHYLSRNELSDALEIITQLDNTNESYYLSKYVLVLSHLTEKSVSHELLESFRKHILYDEKIVDCRKNKVLTPSSSLAIVFGQVRNLEYTKQLVTLLSSRFDQVILSTWEKTGWLIPHNDRSFKTLFGKDELKILDKHNISYKDVEFYGWNKFNKLILPGINIECRKEIGEAVEMPNIENVELLLNDEVPIMHLFDSSKFNTKHKNQIRMSYLIENAAKSILLSSLSPSKIVLYRSDLIINNMHITNLLDLNFETNSVNVEFVKRSFYQRIGDFSYYGGSGLLVCLANIFKYVEKTSVENKPKFLMAHNWILDYFLASDLKINKSAINFHGPLKR